MTARQFLEQAFYLDKRIDMKQDEIDRMRAKLTRATSRLSGMPRGSGKGDWTETIARVMEWEAGVQEEIKKLCEVKIQIAEIINAVNDNMLLTLLEMRYRNYYSFARIAVEMNYSWRHVIRMHAAALVEAQHVIECHMPGVL